MTIMPVSGINIYKSKLSSSFGSLYSVDSFSELEPTSYLSTFINFFSFMEFVCNLVNLKNTYRVILKILIKNI